MFTESKFSPFDFNMPIFNWFYPMSYKEKDVDKETINNIFNQSTERVRNRSLYFSYTFLPGYMRFLPFYTRNIKG